MLSSYCLSILFLVSYVSCLGQLNIIRTDMPQQMAIFAESQLDLLLSTGTDISIVEKEMVHVMDKIYGKSWMSLSGTFTRINGIQTMKNRSILFEYEDTKIFLAQLQNGTNSNKTEMDYQSLLKQALNSTLEVTDIIEYSGSLTNISRIELHTKNALSSIGSCPDDESVEHGENGCLITLAIRLRDEIEKETKLECIVVTGLKLKFYRAYDSPNLSKHLIHNSYEFVLGPLVFHITVYER